MEHRLLSDPRVLARTNLIETYVGLASAVPGTRVERIGETTLVTGEPGLSFCNFAAGFDLLADDSQRNAAVLAAARANRDFWVFETDADRPAKIIGRLGREGWILRQRLIMMRSQTSAVPDPKQDFFPVSVTTQTERQAVALFMASQFFRGSSFAKSERIARATSGSPHDLYRIGTPGDVIGAFMVSRGEADGLYNLCVRASARGDGMGADAVRWLRREAQQDDRELFLQCEESLVPWYEHHGFARFGTVDAWTFRSV